MRSKNDNKIIFALTIGISTMMALNSGIVAYAEGEDANIDSNPDNSGEVAQQEVNTSDSQFQETADQAIQQAAQAENAVDTAASNADEMIVQIKETVTTYDGGTIAEPSVENLSEEVGKANEDGLVDNLEQTADVIGEASDHIEDAVAVDEISNEAAQEAVSCAQEVVATADNMSGLVEDTEQKAQELVETIESANSKEEALETYNELETLIEQTQETVSVQQQYIDEMTQQYNDAKQTLLEAEENYANAIDDAEANVQDAKDQLEQAKTTVENIESALEEANDKLEYEQKAAQTLNDANLVNSWESQRAYLKLLVVNYILPQMEGQMIDPDTVVIANPPGFDTQDCKYYSFTYTDADGNEITRYFNYDRSDKKQSSNRYAGLGNSAQIVVYEKTEDEIKANDHLFEYYAGVTFTRNELTTKANAGDFAVFVYEDDNNNKVYLVKEELCAAIDAGTIIETSEGYTLTNGTKVTEVVQGANSKVKGGDYTIDVSNAPDLEAFLANADATAQQYQALSSVVNDTKDAIEVASDEVDKLEDAIGTLKNKHGNPILTAAGALGVSDVATYLGITVTQDQADVLNHMTVQEAVAYLDAMLAGANAKVADAVATLDALNEKLEEIGQSIGEDGTIAEDDLENADGAIDMQVNAEGVVELQENGVVTIDAEDVPLSAEVVPEDFGSATGEEQVQAGTTIIPDAGVLNGASIAEYITTYDDVDSIAFFEISEPTTGVRGDVEAQTSIQTPLTASFDSISIAMDQVQQDETGETEIQDSAVPRANKAIEDEESAKAALPDNDVAQKKDSGFLWLILALTGAVVGSDRTSEKIKNSSYKK